MPKPPKSPVSKPKTVSKPKAVPQPSDYELDYAMHDSVHCLAPGLFRSITPGERASSKLKVDYDLGDGERIEFSGPEPLGADDLRVLQGLVAMAGPRGVILPEFPDTADAMTVRDLMEIHGKPMISKDGMVVKSSYKQLGREIGYADVSSSKTIKDCLERMWKVSAIVEKDGKRMGFRLLSEYASDDNKGNLYVALNPRLTAAIVGDIRYTHIDMDEVRTIKVKNTRFVHQRLCGFIDQGKSRLVRLDTICKYIWPDDDLADAETRKKHRTRTKPVLKELESMGWLIEVYGKGKFKITRPKAPESEFKIPRRKASPEPV